MKKILTLMLAVLVCACVLTSCKGKDSDNDVPDKDTAGITDSENKNDGTDKSEDNEKDNDEKSDAEDNSDDSDGGETQNPDSDNGSVKDDGKSDNTQNPSISKPEEKPAQTPEIKPEQKPAESKPEQTKPAESKPETKPETKPAEDTKTESSKLSSMALSDIIAKIYEKVPVDIYLESANVDITDSDALKYNTGLTDSGKISEVCVSEPMIGSIPYSLVLVKVKDAADAADIASQMKSGINQRKWICVEADDLAVTYSGDVVLLFMVGSDYNEDVVKSSDITAAFNALA